MAAELLFHSTPVFSGETGQVDRDNFVIKGVSIITGNQEAEGHSLFVDSTTITQLHTLATARGRVPCNLDHSSGIENTCGYLDKFRIDGNKIRGDLHLLRSHPQSEIMMERAETMPDCFGLSCAFKGKGVAVSGSAQKAARAEKLLSVDVVTRPATGAGLFSAKDDESVDRNKKDMATNSTQNQEPTLADVLAAVQTLAQRQETFEQAVSEQLGQLSQSQSDPSEDREILARLYQSSDEELAQLGLTRAEVDAAVSEYDASLGGETEGDGEGEGEGITGDGSQSVEGAGAGEGQLAGVTGGVSGSTAQTFRALEREIIALKAREKARDKAIKDGEEAIQFEAIETNMATLAEQRDRLLEFSQNAVAEIEALKMHVRTGTRPVAAGLEGVRLFHAPNGELHPFQELIAKHIKAGKTEGQAIQLASGENSALHQDWIMFNARSRNGEIHA